MLENLSIKNIALIDNLQINFTSGFNVLTGESGAGKSILIASISFVLGSKATVDIIREGKEEASVSALFSISDKNKSAREWLTENKIEIEGSSVLIRRTIKNTGRSSIWIEGEQVTRGQLAAFTSYLLDIHGQHDHQSLFNVQEHRRLLDSFSNITEEVSSFTREYALLAKLRDEYSSYVTEEKEKDEKIELLTFAIEEIEKANLKEDEEELLKEEEGRLAKFEKLLSCLENASQAFSSEEGLCSFARHAIKYLNDASSIDKSLSQTSKRLESVFYELEDIGDAIHSHLSSMTFSPERLEEVQERLSIIWRLKKKYGSSSDSAQSSIKDVLLYCERAKRTIAEYEKSDEKKEMIAKQIKEVEGRLLDIGHHITKKRGENKERLEQEVGKILKTLGMKAARFEVKIETVQEREGHLKASPYGFDEVEFLISANEGQEPKMLANIASGGEISRIMLALKTVLANDDEAQTLIFDEIDVGIGGEVASNVAMHIKKLASKKQILLITHLAIIAACADNHTKVEKSFIDGQTFTKAFVIENEKRVQEIARMLSGDSMSEASLVHARELLKKEVHKKDDSFLF